MRSSLPLANESGKSHWIAAPSRIDARKRTGGRMRTSAWSGVSAMWRLPARRGSLPQMRFTYAESMCDPKQLFALAVAAEQAGYHSFTVPDSICYPQFSDSRYPYTPDGERRFLQGKPFIEPFAL